MFEVIASILNHDGNEEVIAEGFSTRGEANRFAVAQQVTEIADGAVYYFARRSN